MAQIKSSPKRFDAIIIGAGPAGAQCARDLGKRGRKVLLMERSQRIGDPNFSSGGTPKETMKDFDLPLRVTQGAWSRFSMQANTYGHIWDYRKTKGYVFDFRELKKFLVSDAIKYGARVMVGTSAEAPIVERGVVRGVKYGGVYGKGEARADVIVDASGPKGVLATKLKLRKSSPCAPGIAIESIVEDTAVVRSLKKFKNTLSFYLGSEYVPHGYGWIFPFGKDAFKVGCCVSRAADRGIVKRDYSDMMAVFKKFLGKFPEFQNLQITELHGEDVFVTGGMERDYGDGFLVIGDAAFQVNPVGGEGIRHGLHSGRMAAEVIDKAIQWNDFSKKTLMEYDRDWHAYVGTKWKIGFKMGETIYGNLGDGPWRKIMDFLSALSPEELFDIAFHYEYSKTVKFGRLAKFAKMIEGIKLG